MHAECYSTRCQRNRNRFHVPFLPTSGAHSLGRPCTRLRSPSPSASPGSRPASRFDAFALASCRNRLGPPLPSLPFRPILARSLRSASLPDNVIRPGTPIFPPSSHPSRPPSLIIPFSARLSPVSSLLDFAQAPMHAGTKSATHRASDRRLRTRTRHRSFGPMPQCHTARMSGIRSSAEPSTVATNHTYLILPAGTARCHLQIQPPRCPLQSYNGQHADGARHAASASGLLLSLHHTDP
ncbi:hypothetical protein NUW54_g14694 [Trametes sanguinea]|uniref:Uncharacterized protein n=1 Tax=Trametes sanguinea TaxID=158606 RepID=A0ACC1MAR4_9APHY|nr:hypothetical protein NUW54_g14694 [Trametes sanguinea]